MYLTQEEAIYPEDIVGFRRSVPRKRGERECYHLDSHWQIERHRRHDYEAVVANSTTTTTPQSIQKAEQFSMTLGSR